MADQIIKLPDDTANTGKKVDSTELTVGANTVQRQRVHIGGGGAAEIADVKAAAPSSGLYGVVTRNIPSGTQTVDGTVSVTNLGLLALEEGGNLDALGGTVATVGGARGSNTVVIGCEMDDTSPVQATEGATQVPRITAYRAIHTNPRKSDGTEIAPALEDGNLATATTSLGVIDDWDETDRCKVNPIAGQAGVQGGSGAVSALTQRVVLATDVALPTGTNTLGSVKITDGTLTATVRDTGATDSLNVAVVDASGTQITSFGGGTEYTEAATAAANPVAPALTLVSVATPGSEVTAGQNVSARGTIKGEVYVKHTDSVAVTGTFWQTTQPVSAASLPLPAGAATEATLANVESDTTALASCTGTIGSGRGNGIVQIGGQFDDASSGTATEDQVHIARITAARAIHTNLRDATGSEIGTAGSPIRTNPTGGTAQPATLASASVASGAFSSGSIAAGAVAAGAASFVKVEDAASADADAGVPAMAVRKATPANTSNAEGDYEMLQISAGRLWTSATVDAALPAGTNTIGNVVSVPATSGGLSIGPGSGAKLISTASTNATSIKASAGQVYGWSCTNVNAAMRFLKLYNKATAPTVGTDSPVMVIGIPGNTAGAGNNLSLSSGIAFSTGIACALTTGVGDTDSTGVALNEIVVNLFYK